VDAHPAGITRIAHDRLTRGALGPPTGGDGEKTTASDGARGCRVSKNQELAEFIWSVADLLRGDYKRSEYGKVILPLTVLRRMDCVLEPTHSHGLSGSSACC